MAAVTVGTMAVVKVEVKVAMTAVGWAAWWVRGPVERLVERMVDNEAGMRVGNWVQRLVEWTVFLAAAWRVAG